MKFPDLHVLIITAGVLLMSLPFGGFPAALVVAAMPQGIILTRLVTGRRFDKNAVHYLLMNEAVVALAVTVRLTVAAPS
jgi:hypothetical protein